MSYQLIFSLTTSCKKACGNHSQQKNCNNSFFIDYFSFYRFSKEILPQFAVKVNTTNCGMLFFFKKGRRAACIRVYGI